VHLETPDPKGLKETSVPKENLESTVSLETMVYLELMDPKDPRESKVMLASPELVSLEIMEMMVLLEIRETKEKWVCQELQVSRD